MMDTHAFGFAWSCRLAFTLLLVIAMGGCTAGSKRSVAGACPDDFGSPIRNFCVVTPQVLWRGARPDKDGIAWLIRKGVGTIVNLELILDDKPALGRAIVDNADAHTVGYYRIHDWEPLRLVAPSVVDDHVAHFLAIVRQQPKPVFVHCRYGQNRTGVMVAVYRMLVEGVPDEAAVEEMKLYRGFWSAVDEKYIRGLSPKRREEILRKVEEWIPKLKMDARVVCANGTCAVSVH